MPSRNGDLSDDSNPRRTSRRVQKANYSEGGADEEDDNAKQDEAFEDEDAEEKEESTEDDMDSDEEEPVVRRKSSRAKKAAQKPSTPKNTVAVNRRTSSRATKFTSSMAEPSDAAFRKRRGDSGEDDSDDEPPPPKKKSARALRGGDSLAALSPHKSPARRHAKARLSIQKQPDDTDDIFSEDGSSVESEEEEDEEEPLKIHRILASRTETLAKWNEIVKNMQTTEIEFGSRWFQKEDDDNNDKTRSVDNNDVFEERFLVKWKDLSYMHCSWEVQADLENFTEGQAKSYLTTFFRKSENGVLFSADERCDGDYFDPAWTQIDRILEIEMPEGEHPALTMENEDKATSADFGIIMDRSNDKFDDGTGRQFLVKWGNLPYSEGSWEFERDLILNDVDYKDQVKDFIRRNTKPKKSEMKELQKLGERERRRLYKIFGEKSTIDEASKEREVAEYKLELQNLEFKNGGQLRDYQAEGVAWMMSNYINDRSCILADEMGLGKTLQTAATVSNIMNNLHVNGPVLIIAPLSTLAHWQREFQAWTDLNTIIYHGSSDDRQMIREHEFAYQVDRPDRPVGMNQLYLKKCVSKKPNKLESPWMVQVVITTPEIAIADDSAELTAVEWECLVVDEAHRLKNHTSKLAVKLRDNRFKFRFKMLLTGTPIQNDVQEFWTLLNFIDSGGFSDADKFFEKYGEMKSKESIDELHDEIRPYILRRLKEDVEKSVPPKEETLIEIELTVAQKQYYRALYEKNVAFLHKKKRALDGPSLNNLAMQLRKCCNHLFLLNGVEDDVRKEKAYEDLSEADILVKGSGKLVLLDKLLPRLKEEGHRILLFSQFKIMLDILEDYFRERQMNYERIDGSITGHRRQQAIDRFQTPTAESREAPFVMMLSTRAGGVGINLTAADTVIIFDSDWNPQNDLQAQARCHRIGQTKSVKVYRLLTRKTYEMQMFHMASLKMGLDQAVLNGFEVGASGEGALSKDEVEKLLRNGAYEIFKEDKEGKAEAESNEFIQQDIDSILQRRARTVVHEGTGSKAHSAAGSTFSKASFKVAKSPDASGKTNSQEDVDVDDPDFWKKLLGEPTEADIPGVLTERRQRNKTSSYAENALSRDVDAAIFSSDSDADTNDDDEEDDGEENGDRERSRWGGSAEKNEWKKDEAESLVKLLSTFGYDARVCDKFKAYDLTRAFADHEIMRMLWSIVFIVLHDTVEDAIAKRRKRETEGKDKEGKKSESEEGGMLAQTEVLVLSPEQDATIAKEAFEEVWRDNKSWISSPLQDAVAYARSHQPRDSDTIERALRPETWRSKADTDSAIATSFAQTWQSLKNRGWKATLLTEGDKAGKTRYEYDDKQYWSREAVVEAARKEHPDLEQVCSRILELHNSDKRRSLEQESKWREQDLELTIDSVSDSKLRNFLERYGCLQLLLDRKKSTKIGLPRKILKHCLYMECVTSLVRKANIASGGPAAFDILAASLIVDKRSKLPHPLWTSRHDALLIHAIATHGWIERESSWRAIANDSTIVWGPPFEPDSGDGAPSPKKAQKEKVSDVVATAYRAAEFLNNYTDFLFDFKGINVTELQRVFGLTRRHEEGADNALDFDSHVPWTVDEAALAASGVQSDSNRASAQDLPPLKDVATRAKLILTKSFSKSPPNDAKANSPSNNGELSKHPYAVLDQSVRCNTFLAELLRGIMKSPPQKVMGKKKHLCTIARDEAVKRLESIQLALRGESEGVAELAKAQADMKNIIKHIDLVRRHLSGAKTRLYKNVLRVILGEEPAHSKTEEGLFPVEKATTTVLQTFSSVDNRTTGTEKTSGERALEAAARKLYVTRRGQDNGDPGTLLELTEVEKIILQVACNVGLPAWHRDWQTQLTPEATGRARGRTCNVSWTDFSRFLVQLAKEVLEQELVKLLHVRKEAGRVQGNAEQVLWNAQRQYDLKETAVTQAEDYSKEPETLAKKTVMMLTRIQRFALKDPNPVVQKKDAGLDPKVLDWMETEVLRWSRSLDLLDSSGNPLGFTAVDFLEDLAEEERSVIEIAASVDVKGSRNILQQVALMSRIRAIFLSTHSSLLKDRIAKASDAAASERWELEPTWWNRDDNGLGRSYEHDSLLLERLIRNGFFSVAQDTNSYGLSEVTAAQVSFKDLGLSKRAIQLRANQLVRTLHTLDNTIVLDIPSTVEIPIDDDSSVDVISASAAKRRPLDDPDGSSSEKKLRAS